MKLNSALGGWFIGKAMAGGDLSGHEAGHRGEMAAMEAEHRANMTKIDANNQIEKVVTYASVLRVRGLAMRKAADRLIDELGKANIQHPLATNEALMKLANEEWDKEFTKSDEQIQQETLDAINEYHKPVTEVDKK